MKNFLSSLVIAIAVIVSSIGVVVVLTDYAKSKNSSISATGSAELDFESDLVVWQGNFSETATTTKEAYDAIKIDAEKVNNFLKEKNFTESEIVMSAVSIMPVEKSLFDDNGNYVGSEQVGYKLSQDVTVTSQDIDKVDKTSRDISQLIDQDVNFESYLPAYYCTTLSDRKLELVKLATANAKERIDIMAKEANATVGKLRSSRLGVFQIVAKNSGTSSYAYDGYFDTSSRTKTANVTIKLEYAIK